MTKITLLFATLLIGLMTLLPQEAVAKVYLVSVGISDYPGNDMDLNVCDTDASDIAELYKKNNGAEIRLLTNKQATLSAVKKAMNDLFAKANANDIVVLFYSGHGEKAGLNLYNATLTFKAILAIFENLKCKNKMIFSDSCFSGSIRHQAAQQSASTFTSNNVMYFLGSRTNEFSIENTYDFKNSYFTHALLRALSGKADANRDRTITARELFDYVSSHVKEYSGDRQHPVMWGHFSDDMPVMKW